jgi:hypothetical protein
VPTASTVLHFYSFLTQGPTYSPMMDTYVQTNRVAVVTCMVKAVYRL